MRALIRSFKYALRGISYCLVNERNMRIHLTVSVFLLALSPFFHLTKAEYAILILAVALVTTCEAINTSIETIHDLISPSYNQLARIAKDAAAAAVLLSSVFAAVVGVIILFRPASFLEMWQFFTGSPVYAVCLILALALAGVFVFAGPRGIKRFFRK